MSKTSVRVRVACLLFLGSMGCQSESRPGGASGDTDPDPGTGNPQPPCTTPQEGCECDEEGQAVDCGSVVRRSGDYVSCSMGVRTCVDGAWTECIGDRVAELPEEPGSSTLALGSAAPCVANPCDPYCENQVDTSTGLMPPTGLEATPTGVSLVLSEEPVMAGTPCTGITISPATQTLTVTGLRQTGLLAEYFNRRDNTVSKIPSNWTVTATQIDPSIDFSWGSSAPGPSGIGVDNFSIRWSGYVLAPADGNYTFYTSTDDGARLWVNSTLVINKWVDQGTTEWASSAITLKKGVATPITFEYFENGGGAAARLSWSAAGLPKQVIPESALTTSSAGNQEFTVTPANTAFTVQVLPAGCFDGTVKAAWSLDKFDRATVSDGVVQLVSPIAGQIKVNAYVSSFTATATVDVKVQVSDTSGAPSNAAALFAGTATTNDTATVLYPYDNTVLPLAMKPPMMQWANGASTETAVKVGLVYPATGTPSFEWSKISGPSANQRFAFPRDVWSDFEKTAKGDTGKVTLQRIVSGVARKPVEKKIKFATGPLRGNIFYTQYGRGGGSKIMRLDPSTDVAAVQAFATDNGCPVCHSMSANGAKFATSNSAWSTNGGISAVDSAGNLTLLSDFVTASSTYSAGNNDWRGFAWAPLTPDGKYIFAANNIWGNSRQSVVGIDSATRTVNAPKTFVSGGNGTGLLADYFMNNSFTGWSWRRFDPKVDYDWSGAPGGPVPSNNFSVRWSGQVEGLAADSYTFEVETTAGVRLTVGGTVLIDRLTYSGNATKWTGTAALSPGVKTAIQLDARDNGSRTMVKLRWSSANTALDFIPQSQLYPNTTQRGALVTYLDTSLNTLTQLEPDISENWGSSAPAPNINSDNFTSTWDALVEAPVAGALQWCLDADDGVVFTVDGVTLLTTVTAYNNCIPAMTVTEGRKYAIRIVHTEKTSSAKVKLGWQMTGTFNREDVPSARIFPPSTYTSPLTGLSVTWYDTADFGATVPSNPANPQSYRTFVPNINWSFGANRLNYGVSMTDSESWSGRFTGRLVPACKGVHEFQVYGDDIARLWVNGQRIVNVTSVGTGTGALWLDDAKTYDFKLDWSESTGNAGVVVSWKPACNGAAAFAVIPSTNYLPTGDTTVAGYVRRNGDNGNGSSYWAWQTPDASGVAPVDVTSSSPANWGLSNTVMMVPSFAPNSEGVVFVDGDSAMNSGWRKGLSTFEFDQAGKMFKNRRSIVNNWPSGDVIKWPIYESDSRTVMYQTTTPGEVCCRNGWTLYGYMGPTNYFEDPGRLWSVDSQAQTPTPVLLGKLNDGERVEDKNKAYQPTMLPNAASGYRWTVFTSTRPYGNVLNLPNVQQDYSDVNSYTAITNYQQIQSQLWVSAIDDVTSTNADRSHPAFWLPNQAYNETASSGYLNERAYWVAENCRPVGKTNASLCDVDEDCCGGTASPRTAICKVDLPLTLPLTRHCTNVPTVSTCTPLNGACASDADCCLGTVCNSGSCTAPPPLAKYKPANLTRIYESACEEGKGPVWRFFDWQAETPADSSLEVYAEAQNDVTKFNTLPKAPTAISIPSVVKVATISGAANTSWVGRDVGALLDAAKLPHSKYLLITLRFIPGTGDTTTPFLKTWRQTYSCVDNE